MARCSNRASLQCRSGVPLPRALGPAFLSPRALCPAHHGAVWGWAGWAGWTGSTRLFGARALDLIKLYSRGRGAHGAPLPREGVGPDRAGPGWGAASASAQRSGRPAPESNPPRVLGAAQRGARGRPEAGPRQARGPAPPSPSRCRRRASPLAPCPDALQPLQKSARWLSPFPVSFYSWAWPGRAPGRDRGPFRCFWHSAMAGVHSHLGVPAVGSHVGPDRGPAGPGPGNCPPRSTPAGWDARLTGQCMAAAMACLTRPAA